MNNEQKEKLDKSMYCGIIEALLFDLQIITKRPKEYEFRQEIEAYYVNNMKSLLSLCDNVKACLLNIQKEIENDK